MEFVKIYNNRDEYIPKQAVYSHIIDEGEVIHYCPPNYFRFVALDDSTFTFNPSTASNNGKLSYSVDNGNTWTVGTAVTVEAGTEVLYKGTLVPREQSTGVVGVGYFTSTGKYNVEGNIMSLLYDDFEDKFEYNGTYTFHQLFNPTGNSQLVSAEKLVLPATTLTEYCYASMFYKCSALTRAPKIGVKKMAKGCCHSMFYQCYSLSWLPLDMFSELEETAYYSCAYMFQDCTALEMAPDLPAMTLVDNCYKNMFWNCTSLINAPSILPAMTLKPNCYESMFQDCTALETAPELPATALANECYKWMFHGCSSLRYVKAMFLNTDGAPNLPLSQWLEGVARNGTFVKNRNSTYNESWYIPRGWEIINV